MTKRTGNQYRSRKAELMNDLIYARLWLKAHSLDMARFYLNEWRISYALVPASTRRRWKCGR